MGKLQRRSGALNDSFEVLILWFNPCLSIFGPLGERSRVTAMKLDFFLLFLL